MLDLRSVIWKQSSNSSRVSFSSLMRQVFLQAFKLSLGNRNYAWLYVYSKYHPLRSFRVVLSLAFTSLLTCICCSALKMNTQGGLCRSLQFLLCVAFPSSTLLCEFQPPCIPQFPSSASSTQEEPRTGSAWFPLPVWQPRNFHQQAS